MDWTKAKSILIVALIVTNLVLIAAYLIKNERVEDTSEMQDATIKLLAEKNIFLKTVIPKEQPKMPKLTVQYDTINEDVINEQLKLQSPIGGAEPSDAALIDATSDFITSCGLMTENVTFEGIDRLEDEINVTYKNYIDDIPVEESYIICTIKDGRITEFKRFWLDPVEVSSTEKKVIPATAALIKFMSECTEDKKIYIEDISLVYWLDTSAFDAESPLTDTAFPAWKISYNSEKNSYIPAWDQ